MKAKDNPGRGIEEDKSSCLLTIPASSEFEGSFPEFFPGDFLSSLNWWIKTFGMSTQPVCIMSDYKDLHGTQISYCNEIHGLTTTDNNSSKYLIIWIDLENYLGL